MISLPSARTILTTMAVGAPYESSKGADQKDNSLYSSGAVYIFTRAGTTWAR